MMIEQFGKFMHNTLKDIVTFSIRLFLNNTYLRPSYRKHTCNESKEVKISKFIHNTLNKI